MVAMTAMAAAVALMRENRSSRDEASGGVGMIVIPLYGVIFGLGPWVLRTRSPGLSIGPIFSYMTRILQNLQLFFKLR